MSQLNFLGYRNGFPFLIPENYEVWDGAALDWILTDAYGGETTGVWYYGVPSTEFRVGGDGNHNVVGPGTRNNFKLTFEQLFKLFWRIRQMQVTGSIDDGSQVVNFDYSIRGDLGSDTENETCIITSRRSYPWFEGAGDNSSAQIGVWSLAFPDQYESSSRIVKVDDDYYFGLEILGATEGGTPLTLFTQDTFTTRERFLYVPDGAYVYSDPPPPPPYSGGYPLDPPLSGGTLTLKFYFTADKSDTPVDLVLFHWYGMTGNIDIAPTKFWTYDGLYNESTGARV